MRWPGADPLGRLSLEQPRVERSGGAEEDLSGGARPWHPASSRYPAASGVRILVLKPPTTRLNMDKRRLTEIFNRGFRLGANARASQGLPLSRATKPPSEIPESPFRFDDISGEIAWSIGYATGYQIGASDAELVSSDPPLADGMMSEVSEQMLEKAGVFQKISNDG